MSLTLTETRVVVLPITPVPAPRATKRDNWNPAPRVVRYREFADRLRLLAAAHRFAMPEQGARIEFTLPMPASWSAKKRGRMIGAPHQQKPDVDNLLKALLDALLPGGDERVWDLDGLTKRWGPAGAITVTMRAG